MTEHLINYAASLLNITDGKELEVNGFAILMLVLFALTTLTEILIAIHDKYIENKIPQAKHTSIVDWALDKFFHYKRIAKI